MTKYIVSNIRAYVRNHNALSNAIAAMPTSMPKLPCPIRINTDQRALSSFAMLQLVLVLINVALTSSTHASAAALSPTDINSTCSTLSQAPTKSRRPPDLLLQILVRIRRMPSQRERPNIQWNFQQRI